MKKILSNQDLNMQEGERHAGDGMNWNNVLKMHQFAFNGLNTKFWGMP